MPTTGPYRPHAALIDNLRDRNHAGRPRRLNASNDGKDVLREPRRFTLLRTPPKGPRLDEMRGLPRAAPCALRD